MPRPEHNYFLFKDEECYENIWRMVEHFLHSPVPNEDYLRVFLNNNDNTLMQTITKTSIKPG